MYKWRTVTQHHDGHEHGYNLELSHEDAFYPVVDGHEYHHIRVTESFEVYGATDDFMYISDNVTQQYIDKGVDVKDLYNGLKYIDSVRMFNFEDITEEFEEFHEDPSY